MVSQSFSHTSAGKNCAFFDVSSRKRLPQAIFKRRNVRGEENEVVYITRDKPLTSLSLSPTSFWRNVCGKYRAFLRLLFLGLRDIPRHSTPIPRHSTPLSPDEKKVRIQRQSGLARKKTTVLNSVQFQYTFFSRISVAIVFGGRRG